MGEGIYIASNFKKTLVPRENEAQFWMIFNGPFGLIGCELSRCGNYQIFEFR